MAFKIALRPTGHEFPAQPGQTVLEAALDAGLALPYGCRNGACGACKGKVIDGRVDHGAAQPQALSDADKAAGMTLFCCAKPLGDLTLECHEVRSENDIPVRTMPCRVQRMERLAADVMALYLQLPTSERLQFIAGQYVEFLLKDGKRRAFSLANAPHDDTVLEIHARLIPGGAFTEYVFNDLHEKDILRFEGPFGSFRLDEGSTRPIVMLAGGTGFAPVKALVEHAIHQRLARPIHVYWGAKDRAGLYMPERPAKWAAENPLITYTPVLSNPAPGDGWTGRTGLVHEAVLADISDLSLHQVYACGSPQMIEAAQRDFVARGLPPTEVFADIFSYAPRK
jgi:CDP-4-dehydro-6-deoxyglucose reductase